MAASSEKFEVLATKAAVGLRAATLCFELAESSIKKNGRFMVALSGGSFPKILAMGMKQMHDENPEKFNAELFQNWYVFWADERCVALDDESSSYLACKTNFLDLPFIQIPEENILPIASDAANKTNEELVEDYCKKIKSVNEESVFDLIFLGMGPDGHTASLFPGHDILTHTGLVSSLSDSPKPPPRRITLTLETINRSQANIFVVTGAAKASVVEAIRNTGNHEQYPAGKVNAYKWLLDTGAAAKL